MSLFINVVIRALLTYATMQVLVHLMGKRELSQLSFKDYVIGITMGSIGGNAITRTKEPFFVFVTGFFILGLIHIFSCYISLKNDKLRRIANGEPAILIDKGNINRENLAKVKLTMDELSSLLRQKNVFNFSTVQYALLEPGGTLSVMLKSTQSSQTLEHINKPPAENDLPVVVIKEGKANLAELERYSFNNQWLENELKKKNIPSISKVLLAQADKSGLIYISLYENP